MRSFLICLIAIFLPFQAFASDISAQSTITAAKVYNDRATLTRSGKVEIPAGKHVLVLEGLPLNIYTDSLRVEGKANKEVVFGAITNKIESFEDFVVPREMELFDKIQTLQDQNQIFNAEKQALAFSNVFLENLGKQAQLRENEEIAKLNLNPENWTAASQALASNMAKNLKSSLEIDIKIRQANEKIQKIQNELNQLRTGQKQSISVTIPLEAKADATLKFDLSYQIPYVTWKPVYDARLDTETGELEIIQYASVIQQTGEDWKNVKLTLSTAQPSRGAGLPPLNAKWLSLYNSRSMGSENVMRSAVPVENFGAANQDKSLLMEESMFDAAPQETAQINLSGYVAEYEIKGPASVKADGSESKLLIGTFETENKLEVQIKPQISQDAYLVAKTTLKGEAPILAGQVNLFRDGAYIGQTYVPMLRQGDEQDLAFGIDDNVTIKRDTLKDESSEAGLITKDNILERHVITSLKNLHKKPLRIAVLETVPVSKDEKIRVEIIKEATTPGYEEDVNNIKGLTKWATELKPGQDVDVKLGWKVSWPKGENISGL